jgi:hypothetical protein
MNLKQIVIVAFGVAVLAAGIGFVVASFGGTKEQTPITDPRIVNRAPLQISSDIQGVRYEEAFTAGHHAFRYQSKVDAPTLVGINWKNCKCASVEICVAPDEWKALPEEEWARKAEDPSLKWTPLEKNSEGFTIPAKAIGWIRIGWKADKAGDERFKADLWLYYPDGGIGYPLEIPVSFIEAVRVRWEDDPEKIDPYVGRLGPGDEGVAKVLIWSATREKFTVEPLPSKPDPCITYGDPTPLTAAELEALSKGQGRKALSGYRVAITVRERAGDTQLDLGPFRREVAWKSNAVKDSFRVHVHGIVLGEVTAFVAGNPDDPRLNMGAVNPERPTQHTIRLETDNPQVEVTLDEQRTTDFLKVEMQDSKEGKIEKFGDGSMRKSWTVYVSFRPESGFRGPFNDPTRPDYEPRAVIFKVAHAGATNEQPRRLKVPVSGQVRN